MTTVREYWAQNSYGDKGETVRLVYDPNHDGCQHLWLELDDAGSIMLADHNDSVAVYPDADIAQEVEEWCESVGREIPEELRMMD
jgi:hypothetical protein